MFRELFLTISKLSAILLFSLKYQSLWRLVYLRIVFLKQFECYFSLEGDKNKTSWFLVFIFENDQFRTAQGLQWMGIRLPTQQTRVRLLVWRDPTCYGATQLVHHSYWSPHTPEPAQNQWWAWMLQVLKPHALGLHGTGLHAAGAEAHVP